MSGRLTSVLLPEQRESEWRDNAVITLTRESEGGGSVEGGDGGHLWINTTQQRAEHILSPHQI